MIMMNLKLLSKNRRLKKTLCQLKMNLMTQIKNNQLMNNLRSKKLKCSLSANLTSLITRRLPRLLLFLIILTNQYSKLLHKFLKKSLKRNHKNNLNQKSRLNQRELFLLNQLLLMEDVKMPLLMLRKSNSIITLMLPIDLTLMTTPAMLLSLNPDQQTMMNNPLIKTPITLSVRWLRTKRRCKLMMKPILLSKSQTLPRKPAKIPTLVIKSHKVMMITLPKKWPKNSTRSKDKKPSKKRRKAKRTTRNRSSQMVTMMMMMRLLVNAQKKFNNQLLLSLRDTVDMDINIIRPQELTTNQIRNKWRQLKMKRPFKKKKVKQKKTKKLLKNP
jgi:hypothetical protein